ncbi:MULTISPECIES: HlyD family secretion protein [unclassified Pseudoalteromonas]|uniref:HlyD family secretion protein n=1 Tax=unclassified Pseudoalteromonas TaxID=194690 RepID=UPI00041639F9|nr:MULTISPECIES: HlyD family efflux transporter periplasmic adaptor subunit [unclassified Pseudoalteromonas]PCC14206.1 HlyD family secretion protein [Pseudoalteromonas sp. JB197]SJN16476.1 Efflux transporter, RND family, MFP subunit [Pseudoalteromonas sp. JB197]
MDIAKTPKKPAKKLNSRYFHVALGVLAMVFAALMIQSSNEDDIQLEKDSILIGKVHYGAFSVEVSGYGHLRSGEQKLLTSLSNATVEEIVLKPGALVEPDSVILRLSNPELEQELNTAMQELALRKATLRQLILQHKREVLQEEAGLEEIRAQYATTNARLGAQTKLLAEGIVSQLDYQETLLKSEQLNKRIDIYQNRLEQLKQVNQEAINIQQELIKQSEGKQQTIQRRFDNLTVRAGMSGVLQKLHIELGQSITAGAKLVLLGSTKDLVALIKVPQAKAEFIAVGQEAIIDTRADKIMGQIKRIDPTVEEGTVTVEAKLIGELPSSARSNLSIDATIVTENIPNTYYVQRPANVSAYSEAVVFLLLEDGQSAQRHTMKFGAASGQYIQLLSPISSNSTVVLSDTSAYRSAETIKII